MEIIDEEAFGRVLDNVTTRGIGMLIVEALADDGGDFAVDLGKAVSEATVRGRAGWKGVAGP